MPLSVPASPRSAFWLPAPIHSTANSSSRLRPPSAGASFAPCLLEFAPSLMISPNVDRSLLTKLSSNVSRILVQEIGLSSNPQDPTPITKCGDSGATQGEITERNIQWRNSYTSRLYIIKTLMEDSLQLVYHCTIQRDKIQRMSG